MVTRQPLRWGVLGTAAIATRAILPALRDAGGEVVAIGSRDLGRAESVAKEHGIASAHGSYRAVLERPDVDAVYIPLPNHLHTEWTISAAEHGKHVLCEKPLAPTPEEAEAMVAACSARGVLLGEAVMYRYHERMQMAKRIVESGQIGAVRHLDFGFSFHLPKSGNIRWSKEMSGGALYDTGSYGISMIRWFAGAEPLEARGVQAPDGEVDLTSVAALLFPVGMTASMYCSFGAAQFQNLTIIGDDAVLRIPRPIAPWLVGEKPPGPARNLILERNGVDSSIEVPQPNNPYVSMIRAFEDAVRGEGSIENTGSEAIANLRVVRTILSRASGIT